jgi:uncharacterized protein (TIGR02680 family)
MTVTELPRHNTPRAGPPDPRWMPSRAGILNIWRYFDEVFEFHQGRLLLRGENGSGKSKALELLLPFLFDANLRANRLSTFGTNERTMHWNLMGDGATGTTRVGYVWLEFSLDGEPQRWFSCGARLQASKHTTTVHADFFTTGQRIGAPGGLRLVTEAGQPLTRAALHQGLGEHGVLHENATDYRAALRAVLFPGMTEQRYDALILALLQLRTPKLSQRLDPSVLSNLLSKALPPLDQQEITDLAEGFERLDRQRDRLKVLDAEVAAAAGLANQQRGYAQRVLRSGAAALISATTKLDDLTKVARRSTEQYDQVRAERAEAEQRVETLTHEQQRAEAGIAGIHDTDEYKAGRGLDELRARTAEADRLATARRAEAGRTRAQADEDAAEHQGATDAAARCAESVRSQRADALNAATRAGLATAHAEVATQLETELARARSLLRAAVRGRRDQLAEVRGALDTHERAVDRRQTAEADLEGSRDRLAAATRRHTEAAGNLEREREALAARVEAWAGACRELAFPDLDSLLGSIDSETALLTLVAEAAESALRALTSAETTARAELDATRARHGELTAELHRLATERDLPPPAPLTRGRDRATAPGAPLWRLVRFADGVAEDIHAPVEAALQASGLLDAWVTPSGMIEGHDIFAEPGALPASPGRSLADVLTPERGGDVPESAVLRLLREISYAQRLPTGHPAAIGADGRWRIGNLTGSWAKDHAEYIGALARQRARDRRMGELRQEIEQVELAIAALDARLAALAARVAAVRGERANLPDRHDLTAAAAALTRAESDVAAADAAVRHQVDTLTQRERDVTAALHGLTRLAAEHGLPTERTTLDGLSRAINAFSETGESWLDRHGQLRTAQATEASLATRLHRATFLAGQREAEAKEAEAEHRGLAARLHEVQDTIGASYREVLARLEALRTRLREVKAELGRATRGVSELSERMGALSTQRTTDASARDLAAETRDAAARRFRHLAAVGFAADAGIADLAAFRATLSGSEGVRAALDAARLLAAAWPSVPYAPKNLGDALHRLAEAVHACRATLSDRADLELEIDEDVQVFTATVDGIRVGAAELREILRSEAEQSRHDITEQERELFDQTLTGDTRRHLAARIREAGELVEAMNARLERVRTASKVAVTLVWQVATNLPAGTRAARDLLLKDPVRLTDADRESLHRFFRDRVEQAKSDETLATWEQQLAKVFDYTAWHEFIVKIDRSNGAGPQQLTKKLHGALSGGEKAIALHLPLFAAVAAHYQTVPQAPRVILLDEVFVGVDSNNRGQVFELLAGLELDLVLTSDHEWCTYRELSGIAIHWLHTGQTSADGDNAVTTTRFVWNGHELLTE